MSNIDIELGIRMKWIREDLGLSQKEFGDSVGVSYSAIGLYENGKRSVPEPIKKSVCREHNVNYLFLTTGIGEPYTNLPDTILEELALQYDLTDEEKSLVRDFCDLPKDQRRIIMSFLVRT